MSDFSIDLKQLKKRPKPAGDEQTATVDAIGEAHGFVDRSVKKRAGRPKSPRTAQVHAWVLPGIEEEIATEAIRRGVAQGVIVEEAWALYKASR